MRIFNQGQDRLGLIQDELDKAKMKYKEQRDALMNSLTEALTMIAAASGMSSDAVINDLGNIAKAAGLTGTALTDLLNKLKALQGQAGTGTGTTPPPPGPGLGSGQQGPPGRIFKEATPDRKPGAQDEGDFDKAPKRAADVDDFDRASTGRRATDLDTAPIIVQIGALVKVEKMMTGTGGIDAGRRGQGADDELLEKIERAFKTGRGQRLLQDMVIGPLEKVERFRTGQARNGRPQFRR
jgi:hypothetical protein